MPSIVQVNVSQTVAPAPSNLQQTGALLSQGATNTAVGTKTLLTRAADLTALLSPPITVGITRSGSVATATLDTTTIVSGSYDGTTGLATIDLSATVGVVPGRLINFSSVTGTGAFASLDNTFVTQPGTTSTIAIVQLATGLTMTITGGNAAAALGIANGEQFWTTIAGATPVAYNGNVLATVASVSTFTYAVAGTPATPATGTPTATPPGVTELTQMATTFFAQGAQLSVYVLELGVGTDAQAVAELGTWIAANPATVYSYLTPRSWANEATFLTFIASFEATTSKTYFFTTMTTANYTSFTALMKCVVGLIEAPGVPSTEFSHAADFWVSLSYQPSTTQKVTPFAFSFLFGVTAYPTSGNSVLLTALKTAGVNYVGSGAEGGITNTILLWGTTKDGRSFNYWYSVDWLQINVDLDITNAVINGSNNPINPLYYNQDGINRLQSVGANTLSRAITFGLALGTVAQTELNSTDLTNAINAETFAGQLVINAVPFIPYSKANPSDYRIGRYAGFAVLYITQQGFINIIFNVNVTDFVTQ